MQTFLPYPDFQKSAQSLDRMRLCKQRVECLQILNCLRGHSKGWENHPAVKMWKGYENQLVSYGLAMCVEWTGRGYKDTCAGKIFCLMDIDKESPKPPWLGLEQFHQSHRSNLLRKAKESLEKGDVRTYTWYQGQGWTDPDNLPYYWPTKENIVI